MSTLAPQEHRSCSLGEGNDGTQRTSCSEALRRLRKTEHSLFVVRCLLRKFSNELFVFGLQQPFHFDGDSPGAPQCFFGVVIKLRAFARL